MKHARINVEMKRKNNLIKYKNKITARKLKKSNRIICFFFIFKKHVKEIDMI